jgi:DNA polymerase III alpha subunit
LYIFELDDRSDVLEISADENIFSVHKENIREDQLLVAQVKVQSDRRDPTQLRLSLVQSLNLTEARCRFGKYLQCNLQENLHGLEEIIQEINDDPQGGYDESSIENEISDRVSEWEDDIQGFIQTYGYDKNFIMDFIDTDSITNTVVNSDGYGSILNSYDGDYDTFNINGTEYYVMRVS